MRPTQAGRFSARSLFRDEQGVTTVGMVVAMLVSLALLFTSAQVYRVESASAEIQEVADVAALAAENEVAEFMIVVQVCDAVVLSMSLSAISVYGLSIAALCVPATEAIAVQLMEFAGKITQARNSFAQRAATGLNALQKALPFLAAAQAASVAADNNDGALPASYFAAAVLVPQTGATLAVGGASGIEDLGQAVDESADGIARAAQEAEEAACAANEAKQLAFEHDCGRNPGYCMYERAGSLAGMSGSENPLYRSVEVWSFSVALKRAQAYYRVRAANEAPESSSSEEQARSALRKLFYTYAAEQLEHGYVVEAEDHFEAFFPRLFSNTDELRATTLYDQALFPVTSSASSLVMHAWGGCREAAGATSMGSIREMEEGGYATCESCQFTAASLGRVAAASTSIDNGFEHHYRIVAEAAAAYQEARGKAGALSSEVKDKAAPLLESCLAALGEVGSMRISATPPGSKGVIAMVVNLSESAADVGFESAFVRSGYALGARAAVSGATLVADSSDETASVISSLLDGFGQNPGGGVRAAAVVLECWSNMLRAYERGQSALEGALEGALNLLPLGSASGLGTWASSQLRKALAAAGLEPAMLESLKPALVNTAHVADSDDGSFAVRFSSVKRAALAASSSHTDPFSALVDGVEGSLLDQIDQAGSVPIASVDFPVGGITIPITLTLPSSVTSSAKGFVERCAEKVRTLVGSISGVRVWS